MLKTIQDFFDQQLKPQRGKNAEGHEHALQLAAAALLIEMSRVDEQIQVVEQHAVARAIQAKFGLNAHETDKLIQLADAEREQATDYYQFTALINKNFSSSQKNQLIEYLWQVAYADGVLDKYERHLLSKIAELLHISHAAYIAAKLRAEKAHKDVSY